MGVLRSEVAYVGRARATAQLPPRQDTDYAKALELRLFAYWACASWVEGSRAWDSEWWGDHGIGVVEIAAADGARPSRRFAASMAHRDELGNGFFALDSPNDWNLKIERMLLAGKTGWAQFAGSVFVLLHELLARRRDDVEYQQRLLAAARAIGFSWSVGQLRPGLPWRTGAAEAAEFGWTGERPTFPDALPLDAYYVTSLPDQLWREQARDAGYQFIQHVPTDELPFVDSELDGFGGDEN